MHEQLIEKAKEKLRTYRAIADYLEMGEGDFSEARRAKRRGLTEYQAAQLAELVGDDPAAAAFESLRRKAKSDDERRYWTRMIGKLQGQ